MFSGYILKFGNAILPNKFLEMESYSITPDQRIELDAYRDATGLLHRNTLPSYKTKIVFTVKPITQTDKEQLFSVFNNGRNENFYKERKYKIQYWNFDTDSYKTGYFYMVDPEYVIRRIDNKVNPPQIYYNPIKYTFIEY